MRFVVATLVLALAGCASARAAAARDPQRCERDPKCTGHQDKSHDCVSACSDDPACIDRCRQVNPEQQR